MAYGVSKANLEKLSSDFTYKYLPAYAIRAPGNDEINHLGHIDGPKVFVSSSVKIRILNQVTNRGLIW